MTLDPQPFTDLSYNAWPDLDGENLIVSGHDGWWKVDAANYDNALAKATVRKNYRDQLATARQTFKTNYDNWPTMTAAQKDAANRNAQRALGYLISDILREDS